MRQFLSIAILLLCGCVFAQQIDTTNSFGSNSITIKDGKIINFSQKLNYNLGFGKYSIDCSKTTATQNFFINKNNSVIGVQCEKNKYSLYGNTLKKIKDYNFIISGGKQNDLFSTNLVISKDNKSFTWHNSQSLVQSNSFDLTLPNFNASYDLSTKNFFSKYRNFSYSSINNKSKFSFTENNYCFNFSDDELLFEYNHSNKSLRYNQTSESKIVTFSQNAPYTLNVSWNLEKNKFSGFSLNYLKKF